MKNLLVALLLAVAVPAASQEPGAVLQQFVNAYEDGKIADLPLSEYATENNSTSARQDHAELFSTSKSRTLILRNVRWKDERVTADFDVTVDEKNYIGVVTFRIKDGQITRIDHEYDVEEGGWEYLADAGQIFDKGTTYYALHNGFVESNPILSNASPSTIMGVGLGLVAVRHMVAKRLPVGQCVQSTRLLSSLGWGAGAYNVAIMSASSGPVGIGLLAFAAAWSLPYKNDCVDGPVRIEEIKYSA